jgi:hypothetical protein
MSGDSCLLDTNIIIAGLNGGLVFPARDYAVSIITEMELLSYPGIADVEAQQIARLLSGFTIVNISPAIKAMAIDIRKRHRLKLPDAVICATAHVIGARLVTDDRRLHGIPGLEAWGLHSFLSAEGDGQQG